MIFANYYDGRQAKSYPVELEAIGDRLHIRGLAVEKMIHLRNVILQEAFSASPAILKLDDGSHCEIFNPDQKQQLQTALRYQPSWVEGWQSRWYMALLAIVLMVAMLVSGYFWGLPKITDMISDNVPDALEISMGNELLPVLEKTLFKESRLSDQRIQQVEDVFARIQPKHTRMPIHVIVRDSESLGANAIALPGGTIVVTDKMVLMIVGVNQELEGGLAKEMQAVLAHEIGHIENKHAVKRLFHDSILTAASATLFGDFSAVASTVPTIFLGSDYSREMESQADDYAIKLLQQHRISPSHLADVLEELQTMHNKSTVANFPKWMRVVTDYAASHPPTAERIAKARAQAISE